MIIPIIQNVELQYNYPVIAGSSVINILATIGEKEILKAYLYDNNSNHLIDLNNNLLFSANLDDNYYSNYTGEQIDNFISEVLS